MSINAEPDMSIVPIVLSPDLTQQANAIAEQHRAGIKEITDRESVRRRLFGLARGLIGAFGRGRDPSEYGPTLDYWYRLSSCMQDGEAPAHIWKWFCNCLAGVRCAPGETWEQALAAMDDATLSEGLPSSITSHDRAHRLARLFRWLSRFHGGKEFHLPYHMIKGAIGLPSNMEAGRVAHRLERAGLVEKIDRGVSYLAARPGHPPRATTWRWIGPP
jgi:hypothetical protein